MSDEQAFWVTALLSKEFGFAEKNVTLVKHGKTRHGQDEQVAHYHLLVPEYDADNSHKVLKSKFDFLCHEKLSRIIEHDLRHPYVPGPKHAAVIRHLDLEGRQDVANAIRHLPPSREPGTAPTSYTASTAAQIGRAGLSPAEIIQLVRDAYAVAADAFEFRKIIEEAGFLIAPGEKRATTQCMYFGGQHVEAIHRMLGIPVADMRAFLAMSQRPPTLAVAPPAPKPQAITALPAAPPAPPAPPIRMLPSAAVFAEIKRQLDAARPQPLDRSVIATLEAENRQTNRVIVASAEPNDRNIAGRDADRAAAAAMSWAGRTLFRRKVYAGLLASATVHEDDIDKRAHIIGELRKSVVLKRKAIAAERQRIETAEEGAWEEFEHTKHRLEKAYRRIAREGLVFADLAELRAFLVAAPPPPEIDLTPRPPSPPPSPRLGW